MRFLPIFVAVLLCAGPAVAETKYPEIKIGNDEDTYAVSQKDIVLEMVAGKKTRFLITSDNSSFQYQFKTDLFADVDIDQIVINHLEIHKVPTPGWLEFDDKGSIRVDFVAKKPGTYKWWIDKLEDKGMSGTITVKAAK